MSALHEFLSEHREEVLASCVRNLDVVSHARSGTARADLEAFLDEVICSLARDAGLERHSPLPARSDTAARLGEERQHEGAGIAKVSGVFAAISQAVGEVGGQKGLEFPASEYGAFNRCLDVGIATAIERYEAEARVQAENRSTERLGALAHEIRNNLSSAKMALQMIREGQVGVRSRTGDVLARALRQIEGLVEQAVLAVRVQSGCPLELRRIEVGELLIEMCDATVTTRGVRIEHHADPALVVDADERVLRSALGNLLQNGVKFTRDEGRVVARARASAGDVVIEVEDECGGLADGTEKQIFQPFVQRGADRSGLGLGLTITRDAVVALGGSITVRNLPGRGCVFAITLPGPPALATAAPATIGAPT